MKTLILSDLHLGPAGTTPIYAGDEALPALVDAQSGPLRVIFNGDTFDLLLDDDPLVLEPARDAERVCSCLREGAGKALFAALGRVLDSGGEVVMRAGNHDLELALPTVQAAVRDLFAAAGHDTTRLTFSDHGLPLELDIGPYKALITHGEQDDAFNRWKFAEVVAAGAAAGAFEYPPGSKLVKSIINPLKREMRFLDLLKPDFQGAILTALAVKPTAVRRLVDSDTLDIIKSYLSNAVEPPPFVEPEGSDASGFRGAIEAARLDAQEASQVLAALDDAGPFAADGDDGGVFHRALAKLGRAALKTYAAFHRWRAGDSGHRFFSLEPEDAEWKEARRLATEFGAQIVVSGHTHARRHKIDAGVAYVNTGTWIELLPLPEQDASVDEWTDFLATLRKDPMLQTAKIGGLRGSACLLDPEAGSLETAAQLIECDRAPAG